MNEINDVDAAFEAWAGNGSYFHQASLRRAFVAGWSGALFRTEADVERLKDAADGLAEALLTLEAVGVRLLGGRVCWCPESHEMRQGHLIACLQARAVLAGQTGSTEATERGEA